MIARKALSPATRIRTRSLVLDVLPDGLQTLLPQQQPHRLLEHQRVSAKRRHLSTPNIAIISTIHADQPSEQQTTTTTTAEPRVITSFSFDSSGWLYVYHLGVAKYLSEHYDLNHPDVRFYGCSAGSIVACSLAVGVAPEVVFQRALVSWDLCKFNPFKMFSLVERALREWISEAAHEQVSQRLSISLAKVCSPTRQSRKLFSVRRVSQFESREHLISVVRASCHIPFVGGVLPRHVKGTGYCYDGGLVERIPQSPDHGNENKEEFAETCITISASGLERAHIKNSLSNPMTLGTIPPSLDKLNAMYELGYQHAILFFEDPANANPALERIRKHDDASTTVGALVEYTADPETFIMDQGSKLSSPQIHCAARSVSPRRRTPSQVNVLETEIRDLAQTRKRKIVRASQVVLLLVLMRFVLQVAL